MKSNRLSFNQGNYYGFPVITVFSLAMDFHEFVMVLCNFIILFCVEIKETNLLLLIFTFENKNLRTSLLNSAVVLPLGTAAILLPCTMHAGMRK